MSDENSKIIAVPGNQSDQQLSVRASLVRRGLQEIAQYPDPDGIDWCQPAALGQIRGAYADVAAPKHGSNAKWVMLVCELSSVKERHLTLSDELIARCRSKTGSLTTLVDARLVNGVDLYPQETVQVELEFVWDVFASSKINLEEMFGDCFDLLLYDPIAKTAVLIPSDQNSYRELRFRLTPGFANQECIVCENCGTEFSPGSSKLDQRHDGIQMFFCSECDSYEMVSPPYKSED